MEGNGNGSYFIKGQYLRPRLPFLFFQDAVVSLSHDSVHFFSKVVGRCVFTGTSPWSAVCWVCDFHNVASELILSLYACLAPYMKCPKQLRSSLLSSRLRSLPLLSLYRSDRRSNTETTPFNYNALSIFSTSHNASSSKSSAPRCQWQE
jgi:hypothetical protein